MKRSAPLRRSTGLKRSGKLNPISPRKLGTVREYKAKAKAFRAARPICEACGSAPTRDVHHKHGRHGGAYLDSSTWLAVCRPCHDWIHAHPKEAREAGLLK